MEFERGGMGGGGEKQFMFLHSEMSKKYAKISCKYLPFGVLLEEEEDDYDYDGGGDNKDNDNVLWW